MTVKDPRPDLGLHGGDALGRFLERTSAWESEPVAFAREATLLAWGGLGATLIGLVWFTWAAGALSTSSFLSVPVAGSVVELCLLEGWRGPIAVTLLVLLVLGVAVGAITAGFRLAGPRLQRVTFVHAVLGLVAATPCAVTIAVVIIVAAIYLALIALCIAAVVAVLVLMVDI